MTQGKEWRVEFDRRAKQYCLSQFPGFAALDDEQKRVQYNDLCARWMSLGHKDYKLEPEAAAMAFSRWLVEFHIPNMDRKAVQISASRTIKYGAVEQTFGVSRGFVITDQRYFTMAQAALENEVMQLFDHFERFTLPNMGAGGAGAVTGTSETTTEIAVTKLTLELRDGKTYVKVHGGEWQKHGVNIYKEVLEQYGMTDKDIPITGLEPVGWKAIVQVKDGRPRKVLSLTGV